mmetsp:Transcript_21053/g.44173  ORF Transcript_21053/g.44173 Transcript_21053/m.44173 type:complete len:297 (+) Transcript_21053:226-1116(+)
MTFLDRTVCSCCGGATTTIGDLFKLVVPVGWTFVAIAACLAYLVSPLSRGDSPRWGSACLVAFSALAGIGLSSAVYGFHRKTSSFAIEENYTTTAAAAAANSGTAAETPPDAGGDLDRGHPRPDPGAADTLAAVPGGIGGSDRPRRVFRGLRAGHGHVRPRKLWCRRELEPDHAGRVGPVDGRHAPGTQGPAKGPPPVQDLFSGGKRGRRNGHAPRTKELLVVLVVVVFYETTEPIQQFLNSSKPPESNRRAVELNTKRFNRFPKAVPSIPSTVRGGGNANPLLPIVACSGSLDAP